METTKEERAAWLPVMEGFPGGSAPDFTARVIRDVDALVAIVERLAELPCVCHPLTKAEGAECLGDVARELLRDPQAASARARG